MPPKIAGLHDEWNQLLAAMVDPGWYQARYPDVATANLNPVAHFIRFGFAESRDPNRFFDSAWYREHYPDVAASSLIPLRHYLQAGAVERRNPHPRFDAPFYVGRYPDAAANPLLYHLQTGGSRGYPTEQSINIRDYLPSDRPPLSPSVGVFVDVVIALCNGAIGHGPICQGKLAAERCLASVLADRAPPLGRVTVIDDACCAPELAAWLQELAAEGQIQLIRNPRELGFNACLGLGIDAAGSHDVVVLDSNTRVFPGWLSRLAAHAWSNPRIATVSPFSNTMTVDASTGGTVPSFGQPSALLDDICRLVNTARSVQLPAASGHCRYIRRDALRELGGFDDGNGSEADFCRRAAAAGWQHRLACDTFVHREIPDQQHAGTTEAHRSGSNELPTKFVGLDWQEAVADPFRFAVAAGLFRQSHLPVILMISHDMGGGVRRHIHSLAKRYQGTAYILLLEPTDRGVALSVPGEPNHPILRLPSDRMDDLVLALQSANLSRVHIHHQLHLAIDVRRLIRRLRVPFDVTVHDYYAICPQINLLPWPEGLYCGEPAPAGCNACIADLSSHGARDILSWRREKAWQFIDADRVICPSADVRTRLARYGMAERAIVAPHEAEAPGDWPIALPDFSATPLRIVLLGVLANHKGARAVAAVAEAAPEAIEIHLIGDFEPSFPKHAAKLIKASGQYKEADLGKMLVRAKPHVFWFASSAPETFSYTLSTAIATGLPIVATKLGAFTERLAGRPNTWLVDYDASTQDLLAVFEQVKVRLRDPQLPPPAPRSAAVSDFYDDRYLVATSLHAHPVSRRARRPRVVILPERSGNGLLTPSAYIRLLQPLDHPAIGGGSDIVMATTETVFDDEADIIVTQRLAIPDIETADRLAGHARRIGAKLVYDLDDDLLNIPATHPDILPLRLQAKVVRRMLSVADAVWLSTQGLADRLHTIRPNAVVIENRLDERIWINRPAPVPSWDDPVRILCMRSSADDRDFASIEPVLTRLKAEYESRIVVDIVGMTGLRELPPGLNRIDASWHAAQSYPGFVNWLNAVQPAWHIGLAPMLDTPFNRSRSDTPAMNYAALGLATLASDVPAYRGSIADGPAGQLVRNDHGAWHATLDWLIRDQSLRRTVAAGARRGFAAQGTLLSQSEYRRAAWTSLLPEAAGLRDSVVALTMPHDQSHPAPRTRRPGYRGR
jgi:glycosyltransferase involved in cell wall biosynthesis